MTAAGRLPTFVLAGAMKAGTTSLAAWLDAHPDIHVAPQKEVAFFNNPHHWWLGVDWYRRQFAGAGDARAVGDATPLMSNPVAVDHMADVLPDAAIVAVLRDPVDRAYSHYWHLRSTGQERRSFERALRDEAADPEGSRGAVPHDYLHRSRYLPQLEHLAERFPRERLRVVLFDDLRDRPAEVFADVCRLLAVDATAVPAVVGEVRDPRPPRPHPAVEVALRVSRAERWLPSRAVGWVRTAAAVAGGYPPIEPALRARLVHELSAEIGALADWLGRDLSAWLEVRAPR